MGTQAHDLFVIPFCRVHHDTLNMDTLALAEICCDKPHVGSLIKNFSNKMLAKFKKKGDLTIGIIYPLFRTRSQ